MRFSLLIFLILLSLSSCKSARHAKINIKNPKTKTIISVSENSKTEQIIDYAKTFEGVRYKYGGTTKKGMDCSGLIYISFKKEDVELPRISRYMAKQGKRISLENARKGDLLFFRTNKNRNEINHVGLIVKSANGNIEFIHSTTSKGVITSSLYESYWKLAFIEARRVL